MSELNQPENPIRCDVLLLFATSTEKDQLKAAARARNFKWQRNRLAGADTIVYSLGVVGGSRVCAANTDMGPFGFRGSAAVAQRLQVLTGATAVIQVGFAFGVYPSVQKVGDVLVSESIILYDRRHVLPSDRETVVRPRTEDDGVGRDEGQEDLHSIDSSFDGEPSLVTAVPEEVNQNPEVEDDGPYRTDYSDAPVLRASVSLVELFRRAASDTGLGYGVRFGSLLSGGTRFSSRRFLREVMDGVPASGTPIIGGEMEAAGLSSISPPESATWAVVKGISDYGGTQPSAEFELNRALACLNAADFVLRSLANIGSVGNNL